MLIPIGRSARPEREDLVDLLLACHQRIRRFVQLAEEVGRRQDLPAAEVIDACERWARYFEEALPLHVQDEEQSLLPRLQGLGAEVDEALSLMHAEHAAHEPMLEALLETTRAVRAQPDSAPLREQLRTAASSLAVAFEEHLTREEQVLFPVVRMRLSPEVQAQAVAELRARRAPGP